MASTSAGDADAAQEFEVIVGKSSALVLKLWAGGIVIPPVCSEWLGHFCYFVPAPAISFRKSRLDMRVAGAG